MIFYSTSEDKRKGEKRMFSLAYAILCICSLYLALEKDKQNGRNYIEFGGKHVELFTIPTIKLFIKIISCTSKSK